MNYEKLSDFLNYYYNLPCAFTLDYDSFVSAQKDNKFENFMQKYNNLIANVFKDAYLGDGYGIDFLNFSTGDNRETCIRLNFLLGCYCECFTGKIIDNIEEKETDQVIGEFKNYVYEFRKCMYGDCLTEEMKKHLELRWEKNSEELKRMGKREVSFDYYKKCYFETLKSLSFGLAFLRKHPDIQEKITKPLDLNELDECFDNDKVMLIVAYQLFEDSKYITQKYNSQAVLFNIPFNYYKYIKAHYSEEEQRRIVVPIHTAVFDKEHYSLEDFVKDVDEYLKTNIVETLSLNYPVSNSSDMYDILKSEIIIRQLNDLDADWEILPRSNRKTINVEENEANDDEKESNNDKKNTNGSFTCAFESELRVYASQKLNFFDATPYKYFIKGKSNFEGYIGFIYPNGMVVFEKFYENEKTHKPATKHATYIATIENFVEISKRSRTDIINNILKQSEANVYRICHSFKNIEKWKRDVMKYISTDGTGYDEPTVDAAIRQYINDESIHKTP